uniref:Guanine nucleotide-binding protein subunit gamma n=1 Tax=Plectus sambesii TaxID=2011161 RepID=A0A914W7S1_9BILA
MTKRHTVESVQSLKSELCQLRIESGVKPKPVSNCVADLLRFVQDHQRNDPLLCVVPDKMNPFRPKTSLQCLGRAD